MIDTPRGFATWFVAILIATVILSFVIYTLGTVYRVADVSIDRHVVENSRQYAATNTEGFYTRLEAIRKIDVQIAGLPATVTLAK